MVKISSRAFKDKLKIRLLRSLRNWWTFAVISEGFLTKLLVILGRPPLLRGVVCTYHPSATGLNPDHTINAFWMAHLKNKTFSDNYYLPT